jgi:hypothetical protein
VEGKEAPDETNVSPNPVRPASSVIVRPSSIVGRDVQDNFTISDDIVSQSKCSGAIPADSSVRIEAGYMHSKFLSLHREQEGCRKSQRVLPLTQWEQDFCRSGVGCFRRQRLIWRLHDVSIAHSKPSSWEGTGIQPCSKDFSHIEHLKAASWWLISAIEKRIWSSVYPVIALR